MPPSGGRALVGTKRVPVCWPERCNATAPAARLHTQSGLEGQGTIGAGIAVRQGKQQATYTQLKARTDTDKGRAATVSNSAREGILIAPGSPRLIKSVCN